MIADNEETARRMGGDSGYGLRDRVEVEEIDLGGFPVHVVTPKDASPDDRRVYLEIHGGTWIQGGGEACRTTAIGTALMVGARVWTADYRMPPDHCSPRPCRR